jgi:hypothetical protein
VSAQTALSSTRQANQHHVTPAGESADQPLNRVFERYSLALANEQAQPFRLVCSAGYPRGP